MASNSSFNSHAGYGMYGMESKCLVVNGTNCWGSSKSSSSREPPRFAGSSRLSPFSQVTPGPKQVKHGGVADRTVPSEQTKLVGPTALDPRQRAELAFYSPPFVNTAQPEASSKQTQDPHSTSIPTPVKVTEPPATWQDGKPAKQDARGVVEEVKRILDTIQDDLKCLSLDLSKTITDSLITRFTLLERDLSLQEERFLTFVGVRTDELLQASNSEFQRLTSEVRHFISGRDRATEVRLRAEAMRQVVALAGPDGGILSRLSASELRAVIKNASRELVKKGQGEVMTKDQEEFCFVQTADAQKNP